MAETLNIIERIYGKDKESKELVMSILKTLEKNYAKEIDGLNTEEKVALVVQIVGFEKNLANLFKSGINYEKLLKIRKVIGK